MATYECSGASIVSSVEELAAGRYRGVLTIDTPDGIWQHSCRKCRASELEAHADADADVEYAYRHYLASSLGRVAAPIVH